jgi:hypothetical protein
LLPARSEDGEATRQARYEEELHREVEGAKVPKNIRGDITGRQCPRSEAS